MSPQRREGRRLKDVLNEADAVCRESERIRNFAEDVMKRRQSWPDSRNNIYGNAPSGAEGVNSDDHS